MTRRRVLLAIAGLTAGTLTSRLTRAADAAQKVIRMGLVSPFSASTPPRALTAFWDRLRQLGYVEGHNLVVEARWAEGRYDQLPGLGAEVIGRKVDLLVTITTPAALAAKNATSTIPIVAVGMGDPIRSGLAATLARPGGNLTGLSLGYAEGIAGKWVELLQETVPRLSIVAVIENPDNPIVRAQVKELEVIAPTRGLTLRLIEVREPEAIGHAFERARRKAQATLVIPDSIMSSNRKQITALAAKYRLPAMYGMHEFVGAGGLMAYGPDVFVMFRRAADYVDKILSGVTPADLPIEQPTQYQLIVNLKTAKALSIIIPESILLRADEVIR